MHDHPAWAEINSSALENNLAWVRARLSPRAKLLGVVKADGYGHGAVSVSRVLSGLGIDYLGVAHVREAEELREGGISTPILILSETIPDLIPRIVRPEFIQTVYSESFVDALNMEAARQKKNIAVHVKVDTGMGRVGVWPAEVPQLLKKLGQSRSLTLQGIFTHFASAEDRHSNFTLRQFDLFQKTIARCGVSPDSDLILHAANSAAILKFPETELHLVRVGLLLYGMSPAETLGSETLQPVLTFKTRVRYLKEVPSGTPLSYGGVFVTKRLSRIATIPVGYADGLPRNISSRGEVLIRGVRFPFVGSITMDMSLVDVTDGDVNVGDEVTLIGRQGQIEIRAEEMARWAETIPYEIVCGIGKRVTRIGVQDDALSKVAAANIR